MAHNVVPITPKVLAWAVKESGFTAEEVAHAVGVGSDELSKWVRGDSLPSVGEARAVARKLRRPLAALLLPTPPKSTQPTVEFRRPKSKGTRKQLNPTERLRLREASRLQSLLGWIGEELALDAAPLKRFSISSKPETVSESIRESLGLPLEQQLSFGSASAAWHGWRGTIERFGIFVLVFPMGLDSCRGFSIWDDYAPIVAVNSSWTAEARIFTLLHELAHLVSRTNSACLEVGNSVAVQGDEVEKWCEKVAALMLIPEQALRDFVTSGVDDRSFNDLDAVSRVARKFRTSRRAAALRLIEAGYANWSLYRSIPVVTEQPKAGGGGAGRTRTQISADRYGFRALGTIAAAVRRDVLTPGDAIDYLQVPATGEKSESRELF